MRKTELDDPATTRGAWVALRGWRSCASPEPVLGLGYNALGLESSPGWGCAWIGQDRLAELTAGARRRRNERAAVERRPLSHREQRSDGDPGRWSGGRSFPRSRARPSDADRARGGQATTSMQPAPLCRRRARAATSTTTGHIPGAINLPYDQVATASPARWRARQRRAGRSSCTAAAAPARCRSAWPGTWSSPGTTRVAGVHGRLPGVGRGRLPRGPGHRARERSSVAALGSVRPRVPSWRSASIFAWAGLAKIGDLARLRRPDPQLPHRAGRGREPGRDDAALDRDRRRRWRCCSACARGTARRTALALLVRVHAGRRCSPWRADSTSSAAASARRTPRRSAGSRSARTWCWSRSRRSR